MSGDSICSLFSAGWKLYLWKRCPIMNSRCYLEPPKKQLKENVMKKDDRSSIQKLILALEAAAQEIRILEAQGKKALFSDDDKETYTRKLHEKAFLLMDLPEMAAPFLEKMERDAARDIRFVLNDFARRAGQAMELSSLFYLSALLYPDDYREGDKNDLEKFIGSLKETYPTEGAL